MKAIRRIFIVTVVAGGALGSGAATWHVDSVAGDDAADGASPATAWRTLARVNKATLAPGDRVLFKRGGLWRGTLHPVSGEPGKPVVYSWYGAGPKPILQNSADRSKPEDWFEESPGLWSTRIVEPELHEKIWDGTSCEGWGDSWQEGVKGSLRRVTENGETFLRAVCTAQPKRAAPQPLHFSRQFGVISARCAFSHPCSRKRRETPISIKSQGKISSRSLGRVV